MVPEKFRSLVAEERARPYPDGGFREAFRKAWNEYDGLVMVMAAGIVTRECAGLCRHKAVDPAVVVADEKGRFAVSLVGGHLGGANRLAQDVAAVTCGEAVLTTASDVRGMIAVDEFAARHAMRVLNPESIVTISSAALEGRTVDFVMPEPLFRDSFAGVPNFRRVEAPAENPAVVLLERGKPIPQVHPGADILYLQRRSFVLGIGCRKGCPVDELEQTAVKVLESLGASWSNVVHLATAEIKLEERAMLELAARHGVPLTGYAAEELNAVAVPHPSDAAWKHLGIHSVSEAAALLASGAEKLLVEKTKGNGVTLALAEKSEKKE